jgi:hypothetical protein
MRGTAMSYRWIVKCKRCSADITFKIVDEERPRDAAELPKPVMMRQALECSLCRTSTDYQRLDLEFRPA